MNGSYSVWMNQWIPVVSGEGSSQYSLLDVYRDAHLIRRIDAGDTLINAALFRLLLAILIDIYRPIHEDEWRRQWEQGCFDMEAVGRYAEQVGNRFDLFDSVTPFYQTGHLETPSGKVGSTLLLLPESASGNNVPLFSTRTEASSPRLCLGEAARRLVTLQAIDVAGIKAGAIGDPQMRSGKTTGNPVGALGKIGITIPMGRNLFESLMLNVPLGLDEEDDSPTWHQPPSKPNWETRPSRGILDLLTWQSRRVRLIPDDEEDPKAVIGVIVAAGDRLEWVDPAHEPHTAWMKVEGNKEVVPQRPIRHQAGKSAWRGMDSLLAFKEDSSRTAANSLFWVGSREDVIGQSYPLEVDIAGVIYGNQSAVIEDVISDSTPMSVVALSSTPEGQNLRDDLMGVAGMAEEIRRALNQLLDNLRSSYGGTPIPWNKGEHPGDQFIAAIDPVTRRFLKEVRDDPSSLNNGLIAWEGAAWMVAWSIADPLIVQVPPSAFIGRKSGSENKQPPINQARAEAYFRNKLRNVLMRMNKPAKEGEN